MKYINLLLFSLIFNINCSEREQELKKQFDSEVQKYILETSCRKKCFKKKEQEAKFCKQLTGWDWNKLSEDNENLYFQLTDKEKTKFVAFQKCIQNTKDTFKKCANECTD